MSRENIAAAVTERTADELLEIVESTASWLVSLDPAQVAQKPSASKWSIQEVIGHLVDSAANNHHRFIRAQQEDSLLEFADYQQEFWVERQDYQSASWSEVVELWRLYNRHLARVMRRINPDKLGIVCRITPHPDNSLEFLVTDYVVHLNHHLDIIRERVASGKD